MILDHDSKENKCNHVIVITCAAEEKKLKKIEDEGEGEGVKPAQIMTFFFLLITNRNNPIHTYRSFIKFRNANIKNKTRK